MAAPKFIRVPVAKLVPAPWNYKQPATEAQLEKLKASIEKDGSAGAPAVRRLGTKFEVIDGNHRLEAIQSLGWKEAWVEDFGKVTKATAILIAQRRNHQWFEDDRAALSALFKLDVLPEYDLDVLETFMPYTREEMEELARAASIEVSDEVPDGEVPEAPKKPVSKPGDLWHLGEHRVLCGDATKLLDLQTVLEGKWADAVWTDPPYNVNYEGNVKDQMAGKTRDKIANDQMTDGEFRNLLRGAFEALIASMKAGAPIYVAHADTEGLNFRAAFAEAGFKLASCIIWNKDKFALGRADYHWKHEPILYGWKPGAAHVWTGERDKCTVIDCKMPWGSPDHPTMKPVALITQMLRNSAKVHAHVLDPFGGSGSTLMACEALNLTAHLIELEPKYVDVIVRRWEIATEKVARLSGEDAFEDVAEARA